MSVARGSGPMVGVLAAMLGASVARGDGECAKGYRDTTPAERSTMTAVLEAAKKALPAAPQGWVILGDDNVSVPTSICGDYEAGPWAYTFTRYYQRVDDQEARNKIIATAAADFATDMEKKQPRLDAITARMQKLGQELAAAAEKGDYARTEEINKEVEKVTNEYQKLLDEGNSAAKMEAAGEQARRDLEMAIVVAVNPNVESPGNSAQNLRLPEGTQAAFRWSGERETSKENHALVLIGPWKPKTEGGWEPVRRANVAAAAAQAISVRVTADESRLAATVESINFKALATSLAP